MGISINIAIQMARSTPFLEGKKNGIMLGRQKMHFRPNWKSRLIEQLAKQGIVASEDDLFQDDQFCESFLKTIGWPALESLDFSAIEGAQYIHDLSEPIDGSLRKKFDVIYDGGTTEHVFDIASSFRNIHHMLKDDGIFISCVGTDGWFGHGFYQVGPDIPWRYWSATLGYDVLKCCTFNRTSREAPRDITDPAVNRRGAEHRYDSPQFLFYVVQKNGEKDTYPATIQSHYLDY
ncbi:class I SAM-dependent methyltransferase [Phaeobacter porticola]|uniref:Methyltransferase domain protein n=1 Tax=Phaeobacter porticola TaxID=1844006 RepID=A0A1L3I6J7_9RHOB|nr:class I SAM-dependent methyltransferase [Phaeobacter porticola]APG47703.1 hypothetical protein PhaeoP97_02309 [Phaeobacter porticola]